KVVERRGARARVVVDNVEVGETPWEAAVAPGSHVVLLRGAGDAGSAPASAPVKVDEVTALTLALVPLECGLRVVVRPAGASVSLDRVPLGRGTWEGRLPCGEHRVEVSDDGFVRRERSVTLTRGDALSVGIELARAGAAPEEAARRGPRVEVAAHVPVGA